MVFVLCSPEFVNVFRLQILVRERMRAEGHVFEAKKRPWIPNPGAHHNPNRPIKNDLETKCVRQRPSSAFRDTGGGSGSIRLGRDRDEAVVVEGVADI